MTQLPQKLESFGFLYGESGPNTARTLMLVEIAARLKQKEEVEELFNIKWRVL